MPSLTPDSCALLGDVVLKFGPEPCLSSPVSHTSIIYQQEGLVVVVQAAGVLEHVIDTVLGRKAALQKTMNSKQVTAEFMVDLPSLF